MFLLAVIEDKLKTLPDQFERDSDAVLLDQIDIKFANKVLVDVGLCITLFDFLEVGDPYIYPAEGSAHQHVRFRMVVFRPFAGEVRNKTKCLIIVRSSNALTSIPIVFSVDFGWSYFFFTQRWIMGIVGIF